MSANFRPLGAPAVLGALALGAAAAGAQVAPVRPRADSAGAADSTRVRALNPVVVTATRTRRTLADVPVSASVVPGAEVRATPAQTTDDALRAVPGLNLPFESAVVAHPTSNFVSMRGLGGIRTLVLLDGVPLNDPFFGYVQWNKVPPALVDRVEIVRGGASNLFGTYALGGVVAITTRTPSADEASAEASYGTNATRHGALTLSRAVAPALRVTAAGDYFDTDGFVRPFGAARGPLDERGRSETRNAFLKVDYAPAGGPTTAFLRTNYYRLGQNQGSPLGTVGQRAVDVAAGAERRVRGNGTVAARAFFEADRMFTNNTDPVTARGVDEFLSNAHVTPAQDLGLGLQWTQPSARARTTFVTGVDARTVTGEDRADVYSAPNAFAYREIGGGTQRTLGAFAQADWFATAALELVASARLDAWQNVNGHLYRAPGARGEFADRSRTLLNPKLALRYRLGAAGGGQVVARAAGYRAFNAPNLDQLYRPYSAQNYANVPNAALGPETLTGADAGLDWTRATAVGVASVQLNGFTNTLRDVITYDAIAFDPVYTTHPVNAGRAVARGAELIADLRRGALVADAGYTLTQSRVTSNPGDPTLVGKTNPDTPRHQLLGSVGWLPAVGPSLLVRGRYLSRRYTDATNARALSPHFVLDASAAAPLSALGLGARAADVELFVQAQNVLDRLYVASAYGFDARGTPRQLFVGVRAITRPRR